MWISAGIVNKLLTILKEFPESTTRCQKTATNKTSESFWKIHLCYQEEEKSGGHHLADKRSWQEEKGQDKKVGWGCGWVSRRGEKTKKRGGWYLSWGGGLVVGKLGPAVRHSGHYCWDERQSQGSACAGKKSQARRFKMTQDGPEMMQQPILPVKCKWWLCWWVA